MSPEPYSSRRSCYRSFRSIDQRLDAIDRKLDHIIWRIPDDLVIPAHLYSSLPETYEREDATDRFIWEDD